MHPLGKVLFGALRPRQGQVRIHGHEITSPSAAMREGAGYAAKDRDVESLCTDASVRDNIAIAGLSHPTDSLGFLHPGRERRYVRAQTDFMKIKCFFHGTACLPAIGGKQAKGGVRKMDRSRLGHFDPGLPDARH